MSKQQIIRAQCKAPDELAELRQRIVELEEAVAARDDFIATIGHELRNPLSPIFLHIQHLLATVKQAPGESTPTTWLVPRLESLTHRLDRFVGVLNRILDVSRISTGTVTLELAEVDLAEVVREVCAGFERELVLAHSELRLSSTGPVRGQWDRMRLEQICANLLSNAIRYGDGNPIEIQVCRDNQTAILIVQDRGIGIPQEDQERIFHRMERVVATRSTGGLGIGL